MDKFPEEYIKRGKFKLHSGEETDVFYDINALLTNPKYLFGVIKRVPVANHYIGISSGGAMIAMGVSLRRLKPYSIIKDGELKGSSPKDDWILIDDVSTTENSLRDALKIVDSQPREIFVVVDRRKDKRLKLEAMFEIWISGFKTSQIFF